MIRDVHFRAPLGFRCRRAVLVLVIFIAAGLALSVLTAWSLALMGQAGYRVPGFRIVTHQSMHENRMVELEVVEYGLPFLCLSHSVRTVWLTDTDPRTLLWHVEDVDIVGAISIPSARAGGIHCLGIRAVLMGLAANSVIVGAALGGVVLLWRAWRQGGRCRRGCCARCGYPLQTQWEICPECGTQNPQGREPSYAKTPSARSAGESAGR